MEFRDYAAKEASAVMGRLLASRADASLRQIKALREAFEAAAREAESAADSAPDLEGELQELVRRLNNAATAAVRAAAQRVQEEAAVSLAAAQGDLEAERTRGEELAALLAEAQAQIDSLRLDLRAETQRAAVAERDLTSAREQIQQAERARSAAEAAAEEGARGRAAVEDELRESRGLLEAALSEAAALHVQLDAARAEIDTVRAELERAHSRYSEKDGELEIVRRSLDDAIAETARLHVRQTDLEASLAAAEAYGREKAEARAAADRESVHLRRSLDDAMAESTRLTTQLEEAAAERGGLEAEIAALRAELVDLRATLAGVEAERDVNRSSVVALENAQLQQVARISELEAKLDAAAHTEASLRAEMAEAEAATAAGRADINVLHNQVDRLAALLDAAVLAADDLSSAPTIADVLHALVRQLSGVYSRVALFRLKGNRLEGEHQIGFDLSTDVTKLVIPLSVDSLIARAASSGTIESLAGAELDDSRHAPFGTSASAALAIPVIVGSDTLAVLYAEEPADASPAAAAGTAVEQHATFAKLLVRHAVALLMRLTQELKAISELRDYAIMLIQEAEQMYVADAEAGKPDDELRRRLRDTIECARDLFSQRAAIEGPAAAPLLDAEIRAAIDAQAGTPFARDLAAVTGQSEHASRAAEAS